MYANYYGDTFGPCPDLKPENAADHLNPLWAATFPANLARMKALGVSVLRIFFLGHGFNYGPKPVFDGKGWRFDPPEHLDAPVYTGDGDGKVRRFEDHYLRMLRALRDAKMQVILSVADFFMILDPQAAEIHATSTFLARGRGDIIDDVEKRKKFIRSVLVPLCEWSSGFEEQIFALEVMNEPSWCVAAIKPHVPHLDRNVARETMAEFLTECLGVIEGHGLESTVGHRFLKDCCEFPTGTIAQFHYYPRKVADRGIDRAIKGPVPNFTAKAAAEVVGIDEVIVPDPVVIPSHDDALAMISVAQQVARPGWKGSVSQVIVGEFASDIDGTHGDGWFELNGTDMSGSSVLFSRLKLLSQKGYPLAAMWPSRSSTADDLEGKMETDRWAAIASFASGQKVP